MSTEEEMTINERRKYLHRMQSRYRTADRQERGQLLDEMEIVTGLHRKSLIRLMGRSLARKRRQRQRDKVYGADVDAALRVIDESLDYICAERLTPALVETAKQLARHGELETNDALLAQLAQISVSTVKRRLATLRTNVARPSRRGGAKRASSLMQRIPTRRIPWDESAPGHLELDLVWHCGDSASGEFVCTLQMIDVATTWSERVGILGRSFLVVQDAYRRILNRLPFRVREIHPDNGSEFINNHSWRFWKGAVQGVRFSRSRPYQKNDNRMVEQKHSPLVRAYLGYDRLDTVAQTMLLNRLYDKAWWHYNFFQPVLRLEAKTLIRNDRGQLLRIQRRFDRARTPFERLSETDAIEPAHHHRLARQRDRINPRRLRQEIYDLIDQIFALPGAVPNVSENVFQTLLFHPQSEMPQTERQKTLRLDFNCTPLQPAQKDMLDETWP
jgi:predicted nucleic acid-binding protein